MPWNYVSKLWLCHHDSFLASGYDLGIGFNCKNIKRVINANLPTKAKTISDSKKAPWMIFTKKM